MIGLKAYQGKRLQHLYMRGMIGKRDEKKIQRLRNFQPSKNLQACV